MNTASSLALATPEADAPLAGPLLFSVPLGDTAEFGLLPEKRRIKVQLTLRLLERMHAQRHTGDWIAKTDSLAALYASVRGCSGVRLRDKYSRYLTSGGDWRELVDGYKGPSQQPAEFVSFLKGLIEENHRCMNAALRKLREVIWPAGHAVPGYGTWMEWFLREYPDEPLPPRFPRKYPAGWSPRNLSRFAPSRAEKALFQGGMARAHAFFPKMKRDTSGLRPMELIAIDDFELDVMCAFRGDDKNGAQLAYVGGLIAIDVATRKKLAWGIGPKLERTETAADGTVKKVRSGITKLGVQGLLYQLFDRHGLPEGYTVTILCENATASISAELELALSTMFSGRVRIERTSMLDNRTLANGFGEHGGAPWEKGWVESDLNYLWNEMGDAKGYKGSNERLNAPGTHAAAARYTQILLGQGKGKLNLPEETVKLLQLPFYGPEEVEQHLALAIARNENRTKHKLLGFDRVLEFFLTPGEAPRPFPEMAALTIAQQQQVTLVERMESPAERWSRLSALHTRVPLPPDFLLPLFLTPKKLTWKGTHCTFVHDGTGYTFTDNAGTEMHGVAEGTELLGYFNPASPQLLYVQSLNGSHCGTLTLLGGRPEGVDIRDKEATNMVRAIRAQIVNRSKEIVRERHTVADAEAGAAFLHNQPLIAPHLGNLPAQTRDALRKTATLAVPKGETAPAPLSAAILAGEAQIATRKAEARAADRGISASAASNALADLTE